MANEALQKKFAEWVLDTWGKALTPGGSYELGLFEAYEAGWEAALSRSAEPSTQKFTEKGVPKLDRLPGAPDTTARNLLRNSLDQIRQLSKWDGPDAAPKRMHEIWQKVSRLIENLDWELESRSPSTPQQFEIRVKVYADSAETEQFVVELSPGEIKKIRDGIHLKWLAPSSSAPEIHCNNPNHHLTDGTSHPHEIEASCMASAPEGTTKR